MKRFLTLVLCMTVIMSVSLSAKAQDVTITLYPGWNWISYPKAEVLDINTALGDFAPVDGDRIKSQFTNSAYHNGYWRGGVTHFMPGWGYMYYSNRTEIVSFVFGETVPQLIVTTMEPTEITSISAACGGNIAIGSGDYLPVILRGLCWNTSPNPTINDNYLEAGNGLGSFTVLMTALTSATTYYLRAFAITETGTFYGNEMSFTTLDVPVGVINSLFSVSETQQVYFSQGNLQYIGSATTPYWKFAENQWDYLGNNGQGSANINVDRDLFGWGTSGINHGSICYQPWSTSTTHSNYYAYGSPTANLNESTGQADWGYNAISNGGNHVNQWRTLSKTEWNYVIHNRNTISGSRFVKAKINGIAGMILFPDDWSNSIIELSNINQSEADWDCNVIDTSVWTSVLEVNGAVFLPSACARQECQVYGGLHYWTSSYDEVHSNCAYALSNFGNLSSTYIGRSEGLAVRLVQDYCGN